MDIDPWDLILVLLGQQGMSLFDLGTNRFEFLLYPCHDDGMVVAFSFLLLVVVLWFLWLRWQ